jgi:hypothetical protein
LELYFFSCLKAQFKSYRNQVGFQLLAKLKMEMQPMNRISIAQLPLVARVAVGIAFFNIWWSFEEFVIDRSEVWRYMPDYKVGHLCVWDLTVASIIAASMWLASRQKRAA